MRARTGVRGFGPEPLIRFFREMDINLKWVEDPFPAIWEKFVFIAGFGLVPAYSGKTLGNFAAGRELLGLVRTIMSEIVAIAKKRGVNLPGVIVQTSIGKANNFPFETKTSYQRDIETKGRRNEGNLFVGTILRMGNAEGIPTLVTKRIYGEIEPRL